MRELEYKNLEFSHADGLLNIWADADVVQYTNMQLPCTIDDVKKRIEAFKSFDAFAVMQNEEVIGVIGCPPIRRENLQFGLFYQFRKSSWGQGNATIAAKWLLDYMKRKYKTVTLFADVIVDNAASEKILQKLGFEQFSQEWIQRDGVSLTVHNYRL